MKQENRPRVSKSNIIRKISAMTGTTTNDKLFVRLNKVSRKSLVIIGR
jgi:hypothetical protein